MKASQDGNSGNGGKHRGNLPLVAMLTAIVFGMVMAWYLPWASKHSSVSARTLAWNSAAGLMEAGAQEALRQIYYSGATNLPAHGWTLAADGFYHKSRSFGDGGFFDAAILSSAPPVIYATANVPTPEPLSSSEYIRRRVRVTTTNAPAAGAAVGSEPVTIGPGGYVVSTWLEVNPNSPLR
jgi:hypothetical protein